MAWFAPEHYRLLSVTSPRRAGIAAGRVCIIRINWGCGVVRAASLAAPAGSSCQLQVGWWLTMHSICECLWNLPINLFTPHTWETGTGFHCHSVLKGLLGNSMQRQLCCPHSCSRIPCLWAPRYPAVLGLFRYFLHNFSPLCFFLCCESLCGLSWFIFTAQWKV